MGIAGFIIATAIFVIAFVFWTDWKEKREGQTSFMWRICQICCRNGKPCHNCRIYRHFSIFPYRARF